jgi:hypothetical protein
MSESAELKITPLNEEEIRALADRLEQEKDFDSDLSRAIFTILVVGYEYQQLYTTLQAYYAASTAACHDIAGACAKTIGLRDMKKIQRMYKIAGDIAGNIPARAQALLVQDEEVLGSVTTTSEETTDEETAS